MEVPTRDQTLAAPSPAFSDTEMATAAALLVQLSSGDGAGAGQEESAGSSSSFSSVATRPPPRDNEDDDEDGPRLRRPRYRPISDVYAVTAPVSGKRRRIRRT